MTTGMAKAAIWRGVAVMSPSAPVGWSVGGGQAGNRLWPGGKRPNRCRVSLPVTSIPMLVCSAVCGLKLCSPSRIAHWMLINSGLRAW